MAIFTLVNKKLCWPGALYTMLNNSNLAVVTKFGDKTESNIVRVRYHFVLSLQFLSFGFSKSFSLT